MKLCELRPEVAGGLGPTTLLERRPGQAVPDVRRLEYRLDDWLGDELLEAFPCFIVTRALADTLIREAIKGFEVRDARVTISEAFKDWLPNLTLPEFRWFVPLGRLAAHGGSVEWSGGDVGVGDSHRLIVTAACLDAMQKHRLEHCLVRELTPGE